MELQTDLLIRGENIQRVYDWYISKLFLVNRKENLFGLSKKKKLLQILFSLKTETEQGFFDLSTMARTKELLDNIFPFRPSYYKNKGGKGLKNQKINLMKAPRGP